MPYTGDLLIVNGVNFHGFIKEYKVGYSKLWKDAERNMAGTISANLIGIFTKLTITLRDGLTEAEMANVVRALNTAYFNATYFDPETQTAKTERFYAGDLETSLLSKRRGLQKAMTFSLVATDKRG